MVPAEVEPTIRRARLDEARVLAEVQFRDPSRESVALAGSPDAARGFRERLLRRALAAGTSIVIVLDVDAVPVGYAELSDGGDIPSLSAIASSAIGSMGIIGAIRAGSRARARSSVDIKPPPGIHLVELQVAPERKNEGLGSRLLVEAERIAVERGAPRLTLTTTIDNPARRLYLRHGFVVAGVKTHPRYEAITGIRGRVLMAKELSRHGG